MYNYRVAICDDEKYYRDELTCLLSTYENESGNKLEICSYTSGEELLADKDKIFNIIILDIEMNEKTGLEVAKDIRKYDDNVMILFATSHENYALGAYEVDALGYLVKPVSYTKLKKYLTKCIISIDYYYDNIAASHKYIEIKVKHELVKIEINTIIYIEKSRNLSTIHTTDSTYTCYETLSNLHNRLDINKFIYIHQGYIVNYSMILEVANNTVILKDYIELPISRKYYKSTKNRFMNDIYNG